MSRYEPEGFGGRKPSNASKKVFFIPKAELGPGGQRSVRDSRSREYPISA